VHDVKIYDFELGLTDVAELLSFDGIWPAEHHFHRYTMCRN